MANYDIRPLQMRMLKVLEALDKTCAAHGLKYGIFAGSLIGAVRHKGFIPWDDDMDVLMPRPDYERFIAHSTEWLPAPYEFVCGENDPEYPLPFGKIQDASTTLIERRHLSYLGGIYVDVFPLDAVPSNTLKRHLHFAKYEYLKQALYFVHRDPYRHGHGPSSWVPLLARKMYTMTGLQKAIRRLLTKYDYDGCKLVADYTDGLKGVMSKDVEGVYSLYEFEGETFQGVKRYDDYLTQMYGDYMKIPDGEHQRQHNFHYMDLTKPYREYKEEV
jgi:lipopolysaccharide cholinephosphotransferase